MKHILCPTFIVLLIVNCVQATEVPFVELEGHTALVGLADFMPDGKQILTASRDESFRIWDAETGKELQKLAPRTGAFWQDAFSPDKKKFVTADRRNRAVRIWDTESGNELQRLQLDPNSRANVGNYFIRLISYDPMVRSIAFSPDGTKLATASNDGCVRVWDLSAIMEDNQ